MAGHSIEFDEMAFYNKEHGIEGDETFQSLKTSKKIKNSKKLYTEMTQTLQTFLDDSDAVNIAQAEYVHCTYLLNCPDDVDDFDGDTFEAAKAKCIKRFRKKLSQLEQHAFYQIAILKSGLKDSKVENTRLQQKDLKNSRKRAKFEDAPKKPSTAYQIYKDEKKSAGLEGAELQTAIEGYKVLTDDEKANYHQLAKKHADVYARELNKYVEQLDDEEREEFESNKKIKLEVPKPKMSTLFPGKPKKKAIGIYFHFVKTEKKIDKEVIKQYGDSLTGTELRNTRAKELYEKLSTSKKEKMKAEQEKLKVEDETLFNNWYDSLPEETQAMYDRANLVDSKSPVLPPWLKKEPGEIPKTVNAWLRRVLELKYINDNSEGKQAAISTELAEMKTNREKCNKKYTKALKRFKEEHQKWLDGLNVFQIELLEDYKKSKELPTATSKDLTFVSELIEQLAQLENADDKCNLITDPDVLPKIKKLFIHSIAMNSKSSVERQQKKWVSMVEGTKCYKQLFAYITKVKLQGPSNEVKKKSAFVKKMETEYGPGHPAKPRAVFQRYQEQCKEQDPTLSAKDISVQYRRMKKSELLSLHIELEGEMNCYKQAVRDWVQTIDPSKRTEYCKKYMKKADLNLTEENAPDNVYIMQPKTPMMYDPQIEELN